MKLLSTLILTFASLSTHATDLEPTLGKKGVLLLEESFSGPEVSKKWTVNKGAIRLVDGKLHVAEKSSDKHIGAFRHALPLQDCAVQVEFKLGSMRSFNLGFDPVPGQLKKKGHLYAVIITPKRWSIIEHNDKSNPDSKTKVLATANTEFAPDTTYTLLLESKGNEVVAHITGKEPLKANAADFHVKKPGLVFRMGGKDDQEAVLDNVKVWALE